MFRLLSYILFSLVAAPLEIWSYVFNSLGELDPKRAFELYSHPWNGGLLYVLSILLLAETLFRLASYWDVLKGHLFPKVIFFASVIPFIFLFFIYAFGEKNRVIRGDALWDEAGQVQNLALGYALIIAWLTYGLIEYHKAKMVAKETPRD